MHHRPVGPPLPARLLGTLTRWGLLLRGSLKLRPGRLVLGALVFLAVTALLLAVPVVSGRGRATPTVALDSSSAAARRSDDGSPVVMGVDGQPLRAAAFAGAVVSGSSSPDLVAASGATGPAVGTSSRRRSTVPGSTAVGPAGSGARGTTPGSPGTSSSGTSSSGTSSSGSSSSGSSSSGTGSSGAGSSSSGSGPIAAGSDAPGTDAAAPPDAGTPAAPAAPSTVDQVLALVNQERAGAGCDPLTADPTLAATAAAHSAAMRDRGFLGIVDPEGVSVLGPGARAATVAQGAATPAAVVTGWLADPTARAAILDCGLGSIGVGLASGDGGPWWTALLA